MSRILVVDDKEMMRDGVASTLARHGHAVVAAEGGAAAIARLADRPFDAVVTDLQMPEMDGIELLARLREIDADLPVIFMTAYGTVETAVSALKQGAYDYITKPFSGDELLVAVERAVERRQLLRENQILRAERRTATPGDGGLHEMIGSGPTMEALREHLDRIANSHGTVLVTGESGAGKEVAARRIHERSPRADKPFLAINCAALATTLLESELFGHEKGAFTGADRLRKGRFELADGGTLLLDEISEIEPALQAKLLRVLQEQRFERVGGSRSLAVDVRVIATTNRDLTAEVERGAFRRDLFYRLNVLPVTMPALRDHRDDIPALADHFLARVAAREGRPAKRFEDGALRALRGYAWPGNVREFQNVCERAAVLVEGDVIPADRIAPWLGTVGPRPAAAVEAKPDGTESSLPTGLGVVCDGEVTLDEIERETIIATLVHNSGHRQRSAKALGIGVRTLGLKLKKWKEQQLVAPTL